MEEINKDNSKKYKSLYIFFKRIIDIILSAIGIIILLPLFMIISILIKIDSKGPIIFKQTRFGQYKTTFYIYKFRTMVTYAPKNERTRDLYESHKYITKVGKFLRKTSLDELPQMFNILLGHMSIIGPRPVILKEIELIVERDKYGANDIKPGITGLAQINGRDEISYEEKAKLDGYYTKHMSLIMDAKCFLKTILYVIKREGIVEGKKYKSGEKKSQSSI